MAEIPPQILYKLVALFDTFHDFGKKQSLCYNNAYYVSRGDRARYSLDKMAFSYLYIDFIDSLTLNQLQNIIGRVLNEIESEGAKDKLKQDLINYSNFTFPLGKTPSPLSAANLENNFLDYYSRYELNGGNIYFIIEGSHPQTDNDYINIINGLQNKIQEWLSVINDNSDDIRDINILVDTQKTIYKGLTKKMTPYSADQDISRWKYILSRESSFDPASKKDPGNGILIQPFTTANCYVDTLAADTLAADRIIGGEDILGSFSITLSPLDRGGRLNRFITNVTINKEGMVPENLDCELSSSSRHPASISQVSKKIRQAQRQKQDRLPIIGVRNHAQTIQQHVIDNYNVGDFLANKRFFNEYQLGFFLKRFGDEGQAHFCSIVKTQGIQVVNYEDKGEHTLNYRNPVILVTIDRMLFAAAIHKGIPCILDSFHTVRIFLPNEETWRKTGARAAARGGSNKKKTNDYQKGGDDWDDMEIEIGGEEGDPRNFVYFSLETINPYLFYKQFFIIVYSIAKKIENENPYQELIALFSRRQQIPPDVFGLLRSFFSSLNDETIFEIESSITGESILIGSTEAISEEDLYNMCEDYLNIAPKIVKHQPKIIFFNKANKGEGEGEGEGEGPAPPPVPPQFIICNTIMFFENLDRGYEIEKEMVWTVQINQDITNNTIEEILDIIVANDRINVLEQGQVGGNSKKLALFYNAKITEIFKNSDKLKPEHIIKLNLHYINYLSFILSCYELNLAKNPDDEDMYFYETTDMLKVPQYWELHYLMSWAIEIVEKQDSNFLLLYIEPVLSVLYPDVYDTLVQAKSALFSDKLMMEEYEILKNIQTSKREETNKITEIIQLAQKEQGEYPSKKHTLEFLESQSLTNYGFSSIHLLTTDLIKHKDLNKDKDAAGSSDSSQAELPGGGSKKSKKSKRKKGKQQTRKRKLRKNRKTRRQKKYKKQKRRTKKQKRVKKNTRQLKRKQHKRKKH